MERFSNRILSVQIGDVCCSIICHDDKTSAYLRQIYANFISGKAADITIELDVMESFSSRHIESIKPPEKILKWGEQVAAICRVNGDKPASVGQSVRITVEKQQLTAQSQYKVMNTLLSAAYYTVQHGRHPDTLLAMVLHACGIIRKDRVMIFTGPSETGKTTIARLCSNEHGRLVNDEMVLLSGAGIGSRKYLVQGIPIIGGIPQRMNEAALPACVMMLKQSKRTSIRPLDRVEAYLRFIRQIIAPRDLIKPDDTKVMLSEISQFSDDFTKSVPFFELEFTLDKGPLWKAIDEIEQVL